MDDNELAALGLTAPDDENERGVLLAHHAHFEEVFGAAQRDLIRAGILTGAFRKGWSSLDLYPPPAPSPAEGTFVYRGAFFQSTEPGESDPLAGSLGPGPWRVSVLDGDETLPTVDRWLSGRTAVVVGAALATWDAFAAHHGKEAHATRRLRQYERAARA